MEEKINTLKKNGLSQGEIALMAILTPLIFCVTFGMSSFLILLAFDGWTWFWGPIGFFIILSSGIVWVYIARRLFKAYKKAKILFMTMGFAVSTSALIVWVDMGHMFG